MNIRGIISVFALSFTAFILSVLSGWVVVDSLSGLGEGAVVGGISSLFLALVLTKRRAFFGKIILAGALVGLISFPAAEWMKSIGGWFVEGAFFGLVLGLAHWRLLKREVSPIWIIILMVSWGVGLGGLRSAGEFYGLFLGAIFFAGIISLAAARPLGIIRGWATHPKQGPRQKNLRLRNPRSDLHHAQAVKKTLLVQRVGPRRKG